MLCDSSTFLKFWLDDTPREKFLSFLPKSDLASLRLACHDFSVRAAPALFSSLDITFKTNTFTKPSRLAALDRLGFYVKKVTVKVEHTQETFLPPLVDPETGGELSFTYTPQVTREGGKPKYGDLGTTEILTRQYPPNFHAATNVPAWVRAFSAFVNLEHLEISCPGYGPKQRFRRSTVDYALISLRIAVEKNSLNALQSLKLAPIHPGGLMYLSPMLGFGASPRSASRWNRIRKLTIHIDALSPSTAGSGSGSEPDQFKLLQTYLRNFQANVEDFHFRWIGAKGALPVKGPATAPPAKGKQPLLFGEHPAHAKHPLGQPVKGPRPLHFPKMKNVEIENVSCTAKEISDFVHAHRRTVEELNLEDFELTQGTWDEALQPLTSRARRHSPRHQRERGQQGDIPIMLYPTPMERLEVAEHCDGRRSMRMSMSKWAPAAKKMREGLLGCEQQLKKVLRGSAFPWR